ncbi:hypothetical protein BCR37DRAFT_390520 [Protomyces lactucae-debilis]|uniref:Store-operated calcium entry-associated regulatory factor n=1 Tax=Protomyces lactucae-debilis TaxID=2754530 RepID=A0A1Y2FRZ5_PROLT|nr:uncharacterized protein BCR37DRAFT_390520 [Protomyces lactucae-debilis]ORY86780.1 hypothetical protein BCR37DRAFT_390520 [Protomyces lactucae-debilis]
MKFSSLLLIATQISFALSFGRDKGVPLASVRTLTLRAGQLTTGRRSKVPQLKCVGGSAQGLYEVDVLQCRNLGPQYTLDDIQWSCTAARLPDSYQLGSTEVICEGFNHPDDTNITPGSCGVEYTLHLTDIGEKRYSGFARVHRLRHGSTWFSKAFSLLFVGVLGFIIYNLYKSCTRPGHRAAGGRRPGGGWGGFFGGGGTGGGGDDHGNAPPPYSRGKYASQQSTQAASGMSPWAAAGLGAAGYMLGRLTSGNNREREDGYARTSSWGARPNYGAPQGSFDHDDYGAGPSGSGSGSNMGPMRSSTGFGGTRRR